MQNDPSKPGDPILAISLFEGGLALAAVAIGRLLNVRPLETFQATWEGLGLGLLAAVPLFAVLAVCVFCPYRPLAELVRLVRGQVAGLFGQITFAQLLLLSILAGVGEEVLFRGLVQTAIAGWVGGTPGVWAGLAVATVVFAAGHALSRAYFVLAGLIGLYLGLVWIATGNLLVPITAHALYDLAAIAYLTQGRTKDRPEVQGQVEDADTGGAE